MNPRRYIIAALVFAVGIFGGRDILSSISDAMASLGSTTVQATTN